MDQQIETSDDTLRSSSQEEKPSPSATNDSRQSHGLRCSQLWLVLLAFVVVIIMVISVIFVAHHFYQGFGGQGFLKIRTEEKAGNNIHETRMYLPLRVNSSRSSLETPSSSAKRSPGNVPFYTCGDQQVSCEKYGQPVSYSSTKYLPEAYLTRLQNICCPIRM